jgi:HEAT repeat protein
MQETSKRPYSRLRRFLIAQILLMWVMSLQGESISEAKSGAETEGTKVTIELLEKQLAELNGDARETAQKLGRGAMPTLLKRSKAERTRERALVVECLAEVKGDEAVLLLVEALKDPESDVWNTALDLLHNVHSPAAVEPLTALLMKSPQSRIRGEIARILGRMGAVSSLQAIKNHAAKESDPDVVRKIDLAVARLEDGPARKRVVEKLVIPNAKIRYQAIGDLEYVNDPRLINNLLPLLDDESRVVNVGIEKWPVWHRVCDRALEAVVTLSGKSFPFPTGKRTYSPQQIQKAREVIRQMGK